MTSTLKPLGWQRGSGGKEARCPQNRSLWELDNGNIGLLLLFSLWYKFFEVFCNKKIELKGGGSRLGLLGLRGTGLWWVVFPASFGADSFEVKRKNVFVSKALMFQNVLSDEFLNLLGSSTAKNRFFLCVFFCIFLSKEADCPPQTVLLGGGG